jgi:hypothetical protein
LSGWEPAEATTFEYGEDGRVVASVTIREAEFSPMDVAALLEARRRQRVKRGPHGYPLTESMDPDNQFAFKADKPRRDWAMAELHRAQKKWFAEHPEDKGDPSLVFPVEKLR